MPTPTDRPRGDAYINIYSNSNNVLSVWQVFTTLHFPPFGFYDYYFFSFSYFLLHMVFANYSSKWNYSYATFSILIKTAKQFRSSSNSSFDIFVCLRKCRRENLSWLLCKKIKCVLSEINFIAALSEREKRERREWKGNTAEDYFIAILFDCAHTKLRIRNVETSTVTSR